MPWNALPTLQVTPVRDQDGLRIFAPFQVSDFQPTAAYGVGVTRLDPGATANGVPGTFTMTQLLTLGNPTLPEVLVGGAGGPGASLDIAYDSVNDKLYGVDQGSPNTEFRELNKTTGAVISSVLMDRDLGGLEYSESISLLYAVDQATNELVTFPASSLGAAPPAATTLVGATGIVGTVEGLAQDPLTTTLYAATNTDLYVLNKSTGTASLVGGFGGAISIEGIAYDSKRRVLFGVGGSKLYTISTVTGLATLVGSTTFAHTGLAYDSANDDLLAVAVGTVYKFDFPPSGNEWDITHGLTYTIDGNPHFIDNGGVPTLIVNDVTFPNEDEFYIVDVHRIVASSPQNTVDFALVYKEKDNLDIFDSTTQDIDSATLERVLALAGHNARYRLVSQLTGQPASHEISMYNAGITDLSLDEDDLDDETNQFEKLNFTTDIDNNGDIIRTEGTDE